MKFLLVGGSNDGRWLDVATNEDGIPSPYLRVACRTKAGGFGPTVEGEVAEMVYHEVYTSREWLNADGTSNRFFVLSSIDISRVLGLLIRGYRRPHKGVA